MEAVITNDDRVAMAEVDYVIHHMNERYLNKVPQNVQDFISIIKKKNQKVYVDPHRPLDAQGLKEFTLYFLMILNLKYWCNDERKKDILLMLENNQRKYESRVNNIFDQAESVKPGSDQSSNMQDFSKPREVIKTEIVKQPESEKVAEQEVKNKPEIVQETKSENALEQLKQDTNAAMINSEKENIFSKLSKLINKIKSIIIKK